MARIKLPDMADVYLTANHHVSDTGDRDASAFNMTSRVYPAWRDLRVEFKRILGKTADNVGGVARGAEGVTWNGYGHRKRWWRCLRGAGDEAGEGTSARGRNIPCLRDSLRR